MSSVLIKVRFVANMKAFTTILAISLLLLASNAVDALWHGGWMGPRFSYARYLHNYYNFFLPAYYSSVGYGKRSVENNQQPIAEDGN